ncbi:MULTISPECIES: FtsX-like permease family protein [Bacillus]|uniref:FtsX-like permease family protein n=1 Tax=Bacillus TaxID=1386 RepID=UPI0003734BD9|nr:MULTISPECIES: ABC transporter permease [Bacillus]AIK38053.1 ftsX-like permease family protein [Bacillus pseudomycoides]AJI19647.1 ftsX-like permease family protein [Bacillus pseudomycoides]MEB3056697.1 ABC transporter permease [Bacillus pseudomycoides]PEB38824.1 ABC transporter permease [Bacillus pseudomycoides]PGD92894.1 ABC transporter permease [Bacillus pseudomycoides]
MTFWQFAFKNVTRNSRAYFAYFLSSAFSIAIFFSFAVYLFHPRLQNFSTVDGITGLMIFSEVVIVCFSFFFLLYSIGTFLKVRKKQFGVLTVLGISRRQLKRLVFMENMLIGILSIFVGIQLGLVFSQFFLLVTGKITHVPGLYLYWPSGAILLTATIFLGLFIVVSAFTPMLIRTRKAVRLLKEGKVKQKEQKPSILISLFGALCLLSGYILAGNPMFFLSLDPKIGSIYMFSSIFVIPSLVAIGTYFFFSQICFLLIRILKTRRKFYMKRINMLWISDLASRIRTNINMLFIVAMLSTLAFTMITFIYGFGKFIKLDVAKNNPFPFTYISYDANPLASQHMDWLEKRLSEEQFTYKKFKTDLYAVSLQKDKTTPYEREAYVLKESDYNKLATALHLKHLFVKENETYILPGYGYQNILSPLQEDFKQKNVTLSQNSLTLHVKDYENFSVTPAGLTPQLLILSDDTVHALSNNMRHMTLYNFQVQDWEKTYVIAEEYINKLEKDRKSIASKEPLYIMWEASDTLYQIKLGAASFFFIGTFLGVIFFIGAGSVLYFRMYTDLTSEQEKYITITKIGLTESEMKRSATIQLAILFFVPYIMASIHTMFATKMLQEVINLSLFAEITVVLTIFGAVEIIFFLLIRSLYMQKLSRHISL